MATVDRITITPSSLQVDGGPQSQPFGVLTAEVFDSSRRPVSGCSLTWSSSDSSVIVQPDSSHPYRVRVGSYRPGKATITARETSSGKTATAVVTVNILDAGLPRPGGRSSLVEVITAVRTAGGAEGRLAARTLPVGKGSPPGLESHSFQLKPGDSVTLRVSPGGPQSHLILAAPELDDSYEIDLRETSESMGNPVALTIHTALHPRIRSINLEIVSRNGTAVSDRATPIFIQFKGDR